MGANSDHVPYDHGLVLKLIALLTCYSSPLITRVLASLTSCVG